MPLKGKPRLQTWWLLIKPFWKRTSIISHKATTTDLQPWRMELADRFRLQIKPLHRKMANSKITRDRIDFNRRLLRIAASCGFLPLNFRSDGRQITHEISKLRRILWISTLAVSIMYGVYINITLLHTVIDRSHRSNYYQLGLHVIRGLSASFSYWAYKLFLTHRAEHKILYSFIHTNLGE